jgi:hypothetical protein
MLSVVDQSFGQEGGVKKKDGNSSENLIKTCTGKE